MLLAPFSMRLCKLFAKPKFSQQTTADSSRMLFFEDAKKHFFLNVQYDFTGKELAKPDLSWYATAFLHLGQNR